ncbi:hypothetical protein CSUI_000708 [Cystoisospora suis]|uniref:Uncharacterized protein n=1 Tax=Cystoisospora suis TaxID=483139 RepID=A0A2C6KZZ2_9APIC|nr:hypothetical protein CSUI_000708 [Cystoisospora suis]
MDNLQSGKGLAVQTGCAVSCVCSPVPRQVFDRLASPVPIPTMTRLRALLDSFVRDLGYALPSYLEKALSLRRSSVTAACKKESTSELQGEDPSDLTQEATGGARSHVCRRILREAVLSPRFMSQVSSHLEKCSRVFSRSSSVLDPGTHLLWSWIVYKSVLAQEESNKRAVCCSTTAVAEEAARGGDGNEVGGSPCSEKLPGETHGTRLAASSLEEEPRHLSESRDIGRAFDELLSGIETVLASPHGGTCEDICKLLLTEVGQVVEHAVSERESSRQIATAPRVSATGSAVCPALLTYPGLDRVSSRTALLLFFLKLPYLLGAMARFIAAACKVPTGRARVFEPSAPTPREEVLVDHGKQGEAYEVALLEGLGLIQCVLGEGGLETTEFPSFVSTGDSGLDWDDALTEAVAICTPPNMVWEKALSRGRPGQARQRFLPRSLRTHALGFGHRPGPVDSCLLSVSTSETQVPTDVIGAQRAIRLAVLRTAALLEALLDPIKRKEGCPPPQCNSDLPLGAVWWSPRLSTLSSDISRTLWSALHFGEPLTESIPLFLPPAAHTRLVCQACSLLLTWKGLPRAFGDPQEEASRQLLPLSVAADVAASQTGADAGSFRDTLTGVKRLETGLPHEYPAYRGAIRGRGGEDTTCQVPQFPDHLSDSSAMLLAFAVARVLYTCLFTFRGNDIKDYSRITMPVVLRLLDIPQPQIRHLAWKCFSVVCSRLSAEDWSAFHSPLLRALNDGFPVGNEVPVCLEEYMLAFTSVYEQLLPDPTHPDFLRGVQFVVGMSLGELNSDSELLAVFLQHFSRIVNRGKTVLIYVLKDLMRITLRCLETESRQATMEGVRFLQTLFKAVGRPCVSYLPDVLCRLVMVDIASGNASNASFRGSLGSFARLSEDDSLRLPAIDNGMDRDFLQNEYECLFHCLRDLLTDEELSRTRSCLNWSKEGGTATGDRSFREILESFKCSWAMLSSTRNRALHVGNVVTISSP